MAAVAVVLAMLGRRASPFPNTTIRARYASATVCSTYMAEFSWRSAFQRASPTSVPGSRSTPARFPIAARAIAPATTLARPAVDCSDFGGLSSRSPIASVTQPAAIKNVAAIEMTVGPTKGSSWLPDVKPRSGAFSSSTSATRIAPRMTRGNASTASGRRQMRTAGSRIRASWGTNAVMTLSGLPRSKKSCVPNSPRARTTTSIATSTTKAWPRTGSRCHACRARPTPGIRMGSTTPTASGWAAGVVGVAGLDSVMPPRWRLRTGGSTPPSSRR